MYEKFVNNYTLSDRTVDNVTNAFGSRETFTPREIAQWEYVKNNLSKYNTLSFEADDDNPFGDIGEGMDSGTDDVFADDSGTQDMGSDPFAGIGDDTGGFDFDTADDSNDDIFGGGDDNSDSEERNKQKALLLDRAKSIKEDYDISRQVRANFPKKFLEMKKILLSNIDKLERTVLDKTEYDDVLKGMVVECERMYELVEAYIEVMAKKPYEDIFATYVSIHTSMVRLKNLYIKITGLDKKEIELEESKYDTTI